MSGRPAIRAFFDEATNTFSYLVADPATRRAAVIDPVLDYDPKSGEVDIRSVEAILAAPRRQATTIEWSLETHAHADHLSGSPYVKAKTGARIGIGENIKEVQRIFRPVFNATDLKTDGSDFDRLFKDGERFEIGELEVEVIHTPGHTPACISYKIADAVFVGDTLFMPDYGTARADFPGGDAHKLYRSIRKLMSLPPETRLFMCHDYKAPGRDSYAFETTVGEQRAEQRARARGRRRGRVRRHAQRARCDAVRAHAAAAVDPGEHPRRPLPGRRGERRALPENPGEVQGRRASRGVIAGGLRAPGSSPHPAVADQVRRLHEPGFAPCGAAARGRSVQVQSRADESQMQKRLGGNCRPIAAVGHRIFREQADVVAKN